MLILVSPFFPLKSARRNHTRAESLKSSRMAVKIDELSPPAPLCAVRRGAEIPSRSEGACGFPAALRAERHGAPSRGEPYSCDPLGVAI